MKIFLSYTHEDKQSATTLANGLNNSVTRFGSTTRAYK